MLAIMNARHSNGVAERKRSLKLAHRLMPGLEQAGLAIMNALIVTALLQGSVP